MKNKPSKARNAVTVKPGGRGIRLDQKLEAANNWRETYNPLRDLTLAKAINWMEAGQRGQYADLAWIYYFIEQTDAILFALVDRRVSALLSIDWDIKVVDQESKGQGFDEKLAEAQRQYLRAAYDRIDNLYEAIEHLESAAFRSFAHVQMHMNANGEVTHLEPLDQWNFSRDGMYGNWYWNREANALTGTAETPENKIDDRYSPMLTRVCRRHIDRIALIKFIRKNMGEKDWSSFVELYGIPGAIIIGPQGVAASKEDEYKTAAEAVAKGGSGYLPNGSDVKYPDSVRGTSPFRDFIKYMDEQIVIAGTGGLLTMLTESGSGTLAGGAHSDTFKMIGEMEAQKISEIFQRGMDKMLLAKQFPGKPILAYFELASREKRDPGSILDDCVKATNAGLLVDPEEISEKTGLKLTLKPSGESTSEPGIIPPGFNSSPTSGRPPRASNSQTVAPDLDEAEMYLAKARIQLAEAQQQHLNALAKPLQALYAKAESEVWTQEQMRAELTKFRDEVLPKIMLELGADELTVDVLTDVFSGAFANGIEEKAKQTEVVK